MAEPRWFESEQGGVLAVECATCAEHPGLRWAERYSKKGDECPGCHGAGWIVIALFEHKRALEGWEQQEAIRLGKELGLPTQPKRSTP